MARVIGDESGKASLNYDKLHKVRWLIEEVKERCKEKLQLGKRLTIDHEMMICSKGTYCLIQQYMPKKLQNGASRSRSLHVPIQTIHTYLMYIPRRILK